MSLFDFSPEAVGAIQSGRRLVIPLRDKKIEGQPIFAYAKAYPEFPGMQLAVDDLIARIAGYSAVGTLCRFDPSNNLDDSYPVYISQAAGQSLQDDSHYTVPWKTIEEQLDPYEFTLRVIAVLLLGLEDDKKDNICAEERLDNQDRKSVV